MEGEGVYLTSSLAFDCDRLRMIKTKPATSIRDQCRHFPVHSAYRAVFIMLKSRTFCARTRFKQAVTMRDIVLEYSHSVSVLIAEVICEALVASKSKAHFFLCCNYLYPADYLA